MNLNLAICDDDTNDIAIMKKNILQYTIESDNNIVVSSYFSASDLLSDYKNHLYQISTSGYRNARHKWYGTCQTTPGYGWWSAHCIYNILSGIYARKLWSQPFQFITKPVDYTAIYKLFNNIIKKLYRNSKSIVIIDTDGEKNFVPLNDLLYISSMKENKLHLRYQLTDRALISKGTLSKAEKRLSSHGFVSPSRGFLVNLHHIRSINSTRLLLNNALNFRSAGEDPRNYKISTLSTLLIYCNYSVQKYAVPHIS